MKLLVFAASLRRESYNKRLAQKISALVHNSNVSTDLADFADFNAPLYNDDDRIENGFPSGIVNFHERMQTADGMVIVTPEYNYSIPGTLKNLIDWISRINPMPWKDYPIMLATASPSLVGGNRSGWATRIPLEGCGAFVFPDMFSLASAHEALDKQGNFSSAELQQRLESSVERYIAYVQALKNRDL